jgi:large subunit ribosomal protein L24
MKIKKGDTVIVAVGRDKGRKGKVEEVLARTHSVVVAGVNIYKRHMKKRDEKHPGGIVDQIRPLDVSKVMLICPSCGKPARVGYTIVKGDKYRICKECGKKI